MLAGDPPPRSRALMGLRDASQWVNQPTCDGPNAADRAGGGQAGDQTPKTMNDPRKLIVINPSEAAAGVGDLSLERAATKALFQPQTSPGLAHLGAPYLSI